MSKDITELRAEAKALGINTYQMGKEAIEAAIAEKQGNAAEAAPVDDVLPDEAETAQTAPVDQNTLIATMAMQMAKEAKEMLLAMQGASQKKEGAPEEVIAKRQESDVQLIRSEPKERVFIPSYPGAPRMFTSVVNGDMEKVYPGKEKMVLKAHAENLYRSFALTKTNEDNMIAKEREAMKLI